MSNDYSSATSPSLLLRIRDPDDVQSWQVFERIYSKIVRSYCRQRRLQESDVDDIVQEVMTAVSKAIRSFEYEPAKGRFRGWLGTITANKIKDFLNRKAKRSEALLPLGSEEGGYDSNFTDPDNDWVDIFSQQVYEEAANRARPSFEDKTWKCFELTWADNKSAPQVSEELGIPIHSVYVNKSRVIQRLEKEIRLLAEDLAFDFDVQRLEEE